MSHMTTFDQEDPAAIFRIGEALAAKHVLFQDQLGSCYPFIEAVDIQSTGELTQLLGRGRLRLFVALIACQKISLKTHGGRMQS